MEDLIIEEKIKYRDGIAVASRLYSARHYPAHYHSDDLEIILCLSGQATLKSSYEERILKAGSIYTIDPGDPHFIYSDEDNILLSFYININKVSVDDETIRGCFFACEDMEINSITVDAMCEMQDTVTSISFMLLNREPGYVLPVKTINYFTDYSIDLLIKYFDWLSFIPDPYYTNRNFRERFATIINYCHDHYYEKLNISELAKMVHINENYLSAFMRKTSFGGFKNSVNFIRCYMAERSLLTTDKDVITISSECGFSDPKYFYAAFRKWWQCTPAKFRKNYMDYKKIEEDVYFLSDEEAFAALKDFMPFYSQNKMMWYEKP